MRVEVIYHAEVDDEVNLAFWAESPELPGYTAVGESLEEVRGLVAEGIRLLLGDGQTTTVERMEPPSWVFVGDSAHRTFVGRKSEAGARSSFVPT